MKDFAVEEFVEPALYELIGDQAIKLIDNDILCFILNLRETLDKPITINNWKWGGKFSQRGLRTKNSKHYSPTSQHSTGKALDFNVASMSAEEVRQWIIKNRRLWWIQPVTFIEDGVNWVHVDVGTSGNLRRPGMLVLWHVDTHKVTEYK